MLHRVIRSQRTVHGIAIIVDVDDLLRINRNFDVTRAFGLGNHGDELLLGCYPAPNGNNVGGSFALMCPSIQQQMNAQGIPMFILLRLLHRSKGFVYL